MVKKNKKQRGGVNVVTSCISTTMVLLLLGSVVFFVNLAKRFSESLQENFTISLMLDDNMPKSKMLELEENLKQLPCTKVVNYISKEQALEQQIKALGTDPTEFVKENPMPASFELGLRAEYANHDSLEKIMPSLKSYHSILEISYPEELMESLNQNIRKVGSLMLIIAILLAFVSFALINNTIRLSVHSRRFMIHTMTLVGASWGFIRKPFMIKAFWIGFVSAMLASVILLAGIYTLVKYEPNMQPLIGWGMLTITLSIVFASGILLTLLCAYFTVNRNLGLSYEKLNRY